MAEIRKIRDARTGLEFDIADSAARSGAAIAAGAITPEKTSFGHILHKTSPNLFNPACQTEETISPHYYVNGAPYATTQFDLSYHCTAPIAVEEKTTYWLGLVPAVNGYIKPWGDAGFGVFFYNAEGIFISGTTANGFTTPPGTCSLRFNYAIYKGLTLFELGRSCMLIKGGLAPTEYIRYYDYYLDDQIEMMNGRIDRLSRPVYYHIAGDVVDLIYKYSASQDMRVRLKKKGGNNLFDFYQFALIDNTSELVSSDYNGGVIRVTTPSDWHAPFVMAAKANIDGDDVTCGHFTGGSHEYTNTGSGGTPTARTATLKFFADGREVVNTEGYCDHFEMVWVNFVQAYNTKKANGSGREVLKERHRMLFDGVRFSTSIELIPLENVTVQLWYGLQCSTASPWNGTAYYVGGADHAMFDVTGASTCGNRTATALITEKDGHVLEMAIDPTVDLGDRRYYNGTEGIFTRPYQKAYCYVISGTDLMADSVYTLSGSYRFYSR